MKGFRYLKDVTTLKLDRDACIGCGRCPEVCPHQVFAIAEKKAFLQDRDACMECGACAPGERRDVAMRCCSFEV